MVHTLTLVHLAALAHALAQDSVLRTKDGVILDESLKSAQQTLSHRA